MPQFRYLIVGGGMTADAAVQGIRQVDREGSIGVIGAESHQPYDRPPLSKGLWKGKPLNRVGAGRRFTMPCFTWGIRSWVWTQRTIASRIIKARLMVTKSCFWPRETPRRFPDASPGVIYLRTLDDYSRLRRLTEEKQRFAVIGSGFIGSEIAAALAMNGKHVTMVFSEQGIGGRMFPAGLGRASLTSSTSKKGS